MADATTRSRGISRREFLGGAAAAALLPGLVPVAVRAAASRAAAGAPAGQGASVTVGGTPLRPPAVPLAVRSPYLTTWLPATDLTAATPQFWNGAARGFAGLIRVDGTLYAWGGQPQVAGAAVPAMTTTSLEVTATRSIFTSEAGGIQLVAEWLSPIEPGNLKLESVPLSLLTISAGAVDSRPHTVQVYADVTGEWASSDETALIQWSTTTGAGTRAWAVQLQNQQPLTEDAQMAQWGTAVWATVTDASLTYQSGAATEVRNQFATAGRLADSSDTAFRAVGDDQPVFAFAQDLGSVRAVQSHTFAVGHVRTPLVGYGAQTTPLTPLWAQYWSSWSSMTDSFLAGAPAARERAIQLDEKVQTAATEVGGPGYAAICALAARQCYGGVELVVGPHGTPWLMGKEISSDGDTNTVDIFDQAFLLWAWLDPQLVPLVMEPILDWCASPGWQDASLWAGIPSWTASQSRYCVHDLGVYPLPRGRAPGNGEQMPIEECAGMLIMAAAWARRVGAKAAAPFLSQWTLLWGQWADYLVTQVPTPATQLTTDDWAPVYTRPTGGVNLGIKAIVGLAAAGQIAGILGDHADATKWSQAATGNVAEWVKLSTDPSGQYLNLEQGATGTWTSIYNAYYELVIGTALVPESVLAMEASFYMTQLTPYGMGLQTATSINKAEWLMYLPALLRNYQVGQALLDRDVAFLNDTPSLVPYGDRYDTVTGVEAAGVQDHPTLGAQFALLAALSLPPRPPVYATQSPYPALVVPGSSSSVTLSITSQTGAGLTASYTVQPPAGITVTPSHGALAVSASRPAQLTFEISAASSVTAETVQVPVQVTAAGKKTTLTVVVSVVYASLAAAYDNVGITDDADHTPGNFDGDGNSFSAEALAAVGITPGSAIAEGGVSFTWPSVAAGTADNVVMQGQAVAIKGSGTALGFLGAAANGSQTGAGTVVYSDGTTASFTVGFADWIDSTPTPGDDLVATTAYVNRTTSGPARTPSLFAAFAPLDAQKQVAAVVLPDNPQMHAFAIAVGG